MARIHYVTVQNSTSAITNTITIPVVAPLLQLCFFTIMRVGVVKRICICICNSISNAVALTLLLLLLLLLYLLLLLLVLHHKVYIVKYNKTSSSFSTIFYLLTKCTTRTTTIFTLIPTLTAFRSYSV